MSKPGITTFFSSKGQPEREFPEFRNPVFQKKTGA
jgi:hypothetical protein